MQSALPPLPPKRSSGGRADIYFREVGFGTIPRLPGALALSRWAGYDAHLASVAEAQRLCRRGKALSLGLGSRELTAAWANRKTAEWTWAEPV